MACGKALASRRGGLSCKHLSRQFVIALVLGTVMALLLAMLPPSARAEGVDPDQLIGILSSMDVEAESDVSSADTESVGALSAAFEVDDGQFMEMAKNDEGEVATQSGDIATQSLTTLNFTVKSDSIVKIRLYQSYSSARIGSMSAVLVNSAGKTIDEWPIARYTTSRTYGYFSLPKGNYSIKVTRSYSQDIDGEFKATPVKDGRIECERNDKPASANTKGTGDIWGTYYYAAADVLGKPVDIDYFKFTLKQPTQIKLALVTDGVALCGITDSKENLLNKNNSSSSSAGTAGAKTSYYKDGTYAAYVDCGTFPAGTYYLMTGSQGSLTNGSMYLLSMETKAVASTKSYTVSFNSNGGSTVKSQTVKSGAKATKPANPTRGGYTFKGWYSDKGLTKTYDFNSAVKGNVTLYAKWAKQAAPTSFKDVPSGVWYHDWVSLAAQRGLMTGLKDDVGNYTGYFDPESPVTRAQVATVLWRIAGSPSSSASVMPDVRGHWAQAAVAWCASKGIVTGYTGGAWAGTFRPDAQVTREELATMVYRYAKWANIKTANPPKSAFNSAADTSSVSSWARDAMVWCAAAKVITGVDTGSKPLLMPQGTATRAQSAKVFVQVSTLTMATVAPYEEADEEQSVIDDQLAEPADSPQVTTGWTESGLSYAVVPEGAADADGNAYVLDQRYAELSGRYVGPGVYVTGYTGESADLALPAQIDGVDVVSADLSWHGDDEAATPDPDGRTRLATLTLERGCRLASLDASGNALAELRLAGDESQAALPALRFLDLSGIQLAAFDPAAAPALEQLALRGCPLASDALEALSSWRGATGLAADLEGAGVKDDQPAEPDTPADSDTPSAEPAAPDQPAQPSNPDQPADSNDSPESESPDAPDDPSAPEQPSDQENPTQPTAPEGPAAPDSPDADNNVNESVAPGISDDDSGSTPSDAEPVSDQPANESALETLEPDVLSADSESVASEALGELAA